MKLLKVFYMLFSALAFLFIATGCGEIQNEYYEIHLIVVDEQPFYFINPYEGKDTISAQEMGSGESLFIYLYEPSEDNVFSYEHYFTTIETQYVEENVNNGKLYILATDEIDNLITQFCIDKDAWELTVS